MKEDFVKFLQTELYQLLEKNIFSIEGYNISLSTKEPPIAVIEREDVVDACINIINNLGELLTEVEDVT